MPTFPDRSADDGRRRRVPSTAHGRETCYIAAHQFNGMEYEQYFRGVEAIMDEFGGRPHWGKRHFQTAETLRAPIPTVGGVPGRPC